MKFSFLIANYNNGRYFEECYQSIISQTHKNWEAIIVDDCSTDNSLEVINNLIKGDLRFKLFTNEKNQGCGYTKRKALEFANGKFCGFLDPDDAIIPNTLEISIKKYTKKKIVATYSKLTFCDDELNPLNDFKSIGEVYNDEYFFNCPIQMNAFFTFRKSAYDKTDGINPELKSAVDQDLYLKVLEQGEVIFIPENLYLYRRHNRGISQNKSKQSAKDNFASVIFETFKRRELKEINGQTIPDSYKDPQEIYDLLDYQNSIKFRLIKKIKIQIKKLI